MKTLIKTTIAGALLLSTTNAFASLCGAGYITEVIEGSENANDLYANYGSGAQPFGFIPTILSSFTERERERCHAR